MVKSSVTANEISIYLKSDLERELLEEGRCHICGHVDLDTDYFVISI